jgi:radical SAM superfamily enzyme YgiQ (UPF0313 family)
VNPLILDTLACGHGKRVTTRDVIGAGPRSIAGVLEGKKLKPRILPAEAIIQSGIDIQKFDLLMVSGMSTDLPIIRKAITTWKKANNKPILIGGPVASDPERALLKTNSNLAVIGEGEETLNELLNLGLKNGELPAFENLDIVKGIAYLKGKTLKRTPLRPVMSRKVFNELTPSTKTITDYPLHNSARVFVEVLRGCSNYRRARFVLPESFCEECRRCSEGTLEERYYCPKGLPPGCGYCSVPSLYGPPKSRSAYKIEEEVKGLINHNVRRIVLSGSGFLDYGRELLVDPEPLTDPRKPEPNYNALEELLSKITSLDHVEEGDVSILIENIKGELVTPKAAKILGEYLTGTSVNIGFETGDLIHSTMIGRSSTINENINAVKLLKKAGMKPYAYFIHGLPGQTMKTANKTVNAINNVVKAGVSRIILYRFQPLPMSAFRDMPHGPPARKNIISKKIYQAAQKANRELKKKIIGDRIGVVIAELYRRNPQYHVAYPMLHGPVVLVKSEKITAGMVLWVEITNVISDRMVEGNILS